MMARRNQQWLGRVCLGLGLLGIGELAMKTPTIAQTQPSIFQTGPDAGTTPGLQLPSSPDVGTCQGQSCPPLGIRFKPGQRILMKIINRTDQPISIEKVAGSQPLVLKGKQQISFYQGGRNAENPSVVFWERNETPIRVKLFQPQANTLLIELRFAAQKPGDQSVYVRNDGQVDVF